MSGGVPKRVQISRIQRNTPSKAGNPVPKKAIILCNGSRAQKAMCNYILRRTHALPTPPVREGLRLTAALLPSGGPNDVIGYSNGELGGPSAGGSLVPTGTAMTEIMAVYDQDIPPPLQPPPPQIAIRLTGVLPTSFTFTGGDLSQSYTLMSDQADIHPLPSSTYVVWFNHSFTLTIGQTYTLFLNY